VTNPATGEVITRVAEARAADRIAKERYQRGVESLLTVLETERRLRQAEQAIIISISDVWNVRIDLFLALGGDWGTDITGKPADKTKTDESGPEAEVVAVRSEFEGQDSEFRIQDSNGV
jgi:hypothetical protein